MHDKVNLIHFLIFLDVLRELPLLFHGFVENVLIVTPCHLKSIKKSGVFRTTHVCLLTSVIFSASQCTFQGSSLSKLRKKGMYLMNFKLRMVKVENNGCYG